MGSLVQHVKGREMYIKESDGYLAWNNLYNYTILLVIGADTSFSTTDSKILLFIEIDLAIAYFTETLFSPYTN